MTEPNESSSKPENPESGAYPPPQYPGAQYPPPQYPPQQYPPQQYPPQQPGQYPGGYPPPPPQPYSGYEGGFGAPPPAPPKNGLGTTALILAILSLPAALTVFGGFALGLVAIVIGFIGYRRVKKGEATNGGVAIAGIVLGLLGIVLSAALIAFGVWGFLKVGGGDYFDCMQRAGDDTSAQLQCEDEFSGNIENRFSVTLTPTP
ncbi:hypothetical protein BH11ACT7_BH11ACT7_19170 [soil metagenome]